MSLLDNSGMPLNRTGYVFRPKDDILVEELAAIISIVGIIPPLTKQGYELAEKSQLTVENQVTGEETTLSLSRHFEPVEMQPMPQQLPLPGPINNGRNPFNR